MPVLITEELRVFVVLVFFAGILWYARQSLVALAIPFLVSNLFKSWISENVALFARWDYTVFASALALAAASLSAFRRPALRLAVPWGLLLAFTALLLVLYASTPMYYGWAVRQYLQLFGFGAVALVVPMALVRRLEDLIVLWRALLFTVALVAVTSLFSPTSYGESRGAFLSGADSIGVARTCSFGIVTIAALSPHAWRTSGFRSRFLTVAGLVVAIGGLVYSGSRGPFLHTLAALAVLAVARRDPIPRKTLAIGMTALLFLAVWHLFPESPGLERIASLREVEDVGKDPSIGYRFRAWDYIVETWNRGLFLGQGVGVIEFKEGIQPHSLLLDVLYSGGLLGALSYLAMVVAVVVAWARRPRLPAGDPREWAALPAFVLAMYGAIASSTGYEIASARVPFFWFATCLAGIGVMRHASVPEPTAASEPAAPLTPAVIHFPMDHHHENRLDQSLRRP